MTKATSKFKRLYLESALKGDRRGADSAIDSAVNSGTGLLEIYIEVLCAAQRATGSKWSSGEINTAEEHLVSNITLEQMGRLREKIKPKNNHCSRIVITTLPGDDHVLGARMVADLFLMDGWEVDFLGQKTPLQDLLDFIRARKPDIVALSVSIDSSLPEAGETIDRIRLAFPNLQIIIGGPAIKSNPEESKKLNAHALVDSPKEAIAQARNLIGIGQSNSSLEQVLEELGLKIRELRLQRNFNQKDLGDAAGLDRAYISAIEQGRKNLTVGSMLKISQALQVPLETILAGN